MMVRVTLRPWRDYVWYLDNVAWWRRHPFCKAYNLARRYAVNRETSR